MKKIIYIDDSAMALNLMRKRIGKFFEYTGVELCSKAEEIVKQEDFDCFLVDLMLADSNGIDFSQKIREMEKYKNVPIILVGADISQENEFLAMKTGINCCVRKPVNFAELRELIESQIERPYIKEVKLSELHFSCVIWQRENVHYQFSPDINLNVSDDSAHGAHEKMRGKIEEYIKKENLDTRGTVSVKLTYHTFNI